MTWAQIVETKEVCEIGLTTRKKTAGWNRDEKSESSFLQLFYLGLQ